MQTILQYLQNLTPLQSTNKSLTDLIAIDNFYKDSFLCNESDDTKLTGEVSFIWDDNNGCPGVYFNDHESFLNICTDEDNWVAYYNSTIGFEKLKKAFNFFTS